MDNWSDFLGNKDDFLSILKSLCSNDYDQLNRIIPKDDNRLQDLLTRQDIKNLTDLDDKRIRMLTTVDGLVLIFIYAWTKAVKKFQSPDDLAPLFLVFGRYLFVAYQFNIACNPNSNKEVNKYKDARNWILSEDFKTALDELRIPLPSSDLENGRNKLKSYKPSDSLSRPFQHGIELLHGEICSLFGIKPVFKIREKHVSRRAIVEITAERDQISPQWNPPKEQIIKSNMMESSPILTTYWRTDGFRQSFNFLWERDHQVPVVHSVVEHMIMDKLSGTTLNHDQCLLAFNLLQDLPIWGMRPEESSLAISRREIAAHENDNYSIYHDEIPTLIDKMLDANLLVLDGTDITIENPVIRDYAFSNGYLHHYGRTIFIPKACGLTFSIWLFWTLDNLINLRRIAEAGIFLCKIQGSLPGCGSNSWRELAFVAGLLNDHALQNPFIWAILKATECALRINTSIDEGDFVYITNNLFERISRIPEHNIPLELEESINNYSTSLIQLKTLIDSDQMNFTYYDSLSNIALKKPSSLQDQEWWYWKNCISILPESAYSGSDLQNIDQTKASRTRKILIERAQSCRYIADKLAICDLLARWNDPLILDILGYIDTSSILSLALVARVNLLRLAISNPLQYGNWI